MSTPKSKLVPALERGKTILDFVTNTKMPPTVSEIARELELPKSSVSTICAALVEMELLVRRPDQGYQLGPHVMRWANAFTAQSDVVTEFSSIWDTYSDLPGATITLSVLEDTDVVYIATRNSGVSARLFDFRVGMRLPAAFTATGKAFLSQMTEIEVRRLYGASFPEPLTRNSTASLDALIEELALVRKQGYSLDDEQVSEGIRCYGACVYNANNNAIAGVAVSFVAEDMSEAQVEMIVQSVQSISRELSQRMGADIALLSG